MTQLSQWVNAKEVRHLPGVCEAVGAILQSQQTAPARWLPYLSHRRCGARAHLGRLQYLLDNPHISAERFYQPLLQRVLAAFAHTAVTLALDTSMLWNQYCLVEVSLDWGWTFTDGGAGRAGASECKCGFRGLSNGARASL